ncbi:MAG TPA: GDSL-type esterase/lipase family protein [Gemmatimonadaceae bacterium]
MTNTTDAPARYLALGDSYTIGEGVAPEDRWPTVLAEMLRLRGEAIADPDIVARTGWTCDELSVGIDAADPRGPYALVSLLVGVNDQFRGGSASEYQRRFVPLLVRTVALAGNEPSRVLVLSLPDWGVTPFAYGRDQARIAAAIDAFNRVNRGAAESIGAHYVNITADSRRAGSDPVLLAADGLHPAAAMYVEWARMTVTPAVAAIRRYRAGTARG